MLYPKIDTLFKRDPVTFKVLPGEFTEEKYSLISEWEWTEKIDGTNIRVMYSPETLFEAGINPEYEWRDMDGRIEDIHSHMGIGGRTPDAQIPSGIYDYITRVLSSDKLREVFGDKDVVIFGEGYGDKIQNNGEGSYLLSDDPIRQKFIVFDICIGGKFWLKRADVEEVCEKLGLDVVPIVEIPETESAVYYNTYCPDNPIDSAVIFVEKGFKSKLGDGSKDAEGLIGRTSIPLFDALGRRLIVKLKTCDFREGKVKKGKKND